MSARKVLVVLLGAVMLLTGLGLAVGGGALAVIHGTQRDAAGFYRSSYQRLSTGSYALTSDLHMATTRNEWRRLPDWATADIRIRTAAAGRPLFVGIARTADVDRWLAATAHEHVTSMSFGPFRVQSEEIAGGPAPTAPGESSMWVAKASGSGPLSVTWPVEPGDWSAVLMNADGSAGIVADTSVGARTGVLLTVGIGLLIGGLVLLGVGAVLLVVGFAMRDDDQPMRPAPAAPGGAPAAVGTPAGAPAKPATYPVHLEGHLDPATSRWLWLVKWVLVIPHVIVLSVLWLAAAVLTVFAWFAILITGRYPRGIFDFNVGVLRWTWRVSFYAMGAFGTDRYPPFRLDHDPTYPADLSVDYPERLSRGLVLVKSWLLALPHLVIIAVLAGGGAAPGMRGSWSDGRWTMPGGGLIMLLALIGVFVLAVSGGYPQSLFDVVMGMNRWVYRVLAYVGLMRDEYPPFRFDAGGSDPGTTVDLTPPPPTPDRSGDLVGAGH